MVMHKKMLWFDTMHVDFGNSIFHLLKSILVDIQSYYSPNRILGFYKYLYLGSQDS